MVVSSQEVEHGGVNIVVRAASGVAMEEIDISLTGRTYGQPSSLRQGCQDRVAC